MSETVLTVHPNLLHPITGQPLEAIGHRRNGEPIWPVIGGAPEDETEETETEESEDEELGEKGKKALDAEKTRRKEASQRARDAERARDDALAELQRIKAGQTGEDEAVRRKAEIDAAVKEATTTTNAAANRRILRADVLAAATGKLRHPTDALAFGDLDSIELQADGTANQSDIDDLIADVLTRRPDLAATAQQRTPPASEVDAGPQGDGSGGKGKPRQVTEAELKTMTPDQIVKAQNEGRLADLLGG